MKSWMVVVGIAALVTGIAFGMLIFATNALCVFSFVNNPLLTALRRVSEEALLGGPCGASVILGTILFLGGTTLLVSGVRKESPPPSS